MDTAARRAEWGTGTGMGARTVAPQRDASSEFSDRIMANLKVLGMVQKSTKLSVRKGQLALDEPGYTQFLRRWLRHDSRDLALMHVRSTVHSALSLARPEDPADAERLLDEFRGARKGLENLKATYAGDSVMLANLSLLLEKMERACRALDRLVVPPPPPPAQPRAPHPDPQ